MLALQTCVHSCQQQYPMNYNQSHQYTQFPFQASYKHIIGQVGAIVHITEHPSFLVHHNHQVNHQIGVEEYNKGLHSSLFETK